MQSGTQLPVASTLALVPASADDAPKREKHSPEGELKIPRPAVRFSNHEARQHSKRQRIKLVLSCHQVSVGAVGRSPGSVGIAPACSDPMLCAEASARSKGRTRRGLKRF